MKYNYCLNKIKVNFNNTSDIIKSGQTDLFNYKSYYIHSKVNTPTFGKNEVIFVIIDSKEKGEFYNLTAIVPLDNDTKENMSKLIQCLKTFKKQ